MKWLLTLRVEVDLDELRRELAAHGATLDPDTCVPLGETEQVVEADGPAELAVSLERAGLDVKASPSSDLELYDGGQGTAECE